MKQMKKALVILLTASLCLGNATVFADEFDSEYTAAEDAGSDVYDVGDYGSAEGEEYPYEEELELEPTDGGYFVYDDMKTTEEPVLSYLCFMEAEGGRAYAEGYDVQTQLIVEASSAVRIMIEPEEGYRITGSIVQFADGTVYFEELTGLSEYDLVMPENDLYVFPFFEYAGIDEITEITESGI